ncbi:NAD(P)H nitroreductase [Ferrimonas sediminicola]|uniref:NAD(P)H nitroreductase n=1 Tax=Ferrimonas sediminicola TaxID=2569538 RepID=A0A4U1BDK7_9GAMM|nr:nitroreductase family protein [Ferrimonas sediminicola]TKB48865.1 NAD(P)H nitroreductase [Ferrimonas sediminicola]
MINTLQQVLEQRYSTKVFDASQGADEQKVQALIDTLRLAPSSINSQPWQLFVISNPEEKARLAKAAWDYNQPKFHDASHLFVFCAKTEFGAEEVMELEQLVAEVRGTEVNQDRVALMTNYVEGMDPADRQEWLKKQVYLLFGQFLLSCGLLELDACPVEGFLPEDLDTLMGLEEKGLTSVVTALVGVRSNEDFNTLDKAAKVRIPRERFVTEVK